MTAAWERALGALAREHSRIPGGCTWRLSPAGVGIGDAAPSGSTGAPVTMGGIWERFGAAVMASSQTYQVPVELVLATIATESGGNPAAIRFEPAYRSDQATPGQVSPGLMQTLISTARETLADPRIGRAWLLDPRNAITAGTAYIAHQSAETGFDPPVVACCYNAGRVAADPSPGNRWRMRQYPLGTGQHADRFTMWFNDAMRVLANLAEPPPVSFSRALRRPA